MSRWPSDYRVTLGVIGAALVALGVLEARMRGVAHAQALEVISADREAFKRDAMAAATDAAKAGAEQAVRDVVTPWILKQSEHTAADEQAQRETERRLAELERLRNRSR